MAKITLSLDERSLKNGKAQVRIRISHRCTNCFIGSGVYVEPQYFIEGSLHDMIHRKAPMAAQLRLLISEQIQRIENYLADVDRDELAIMTANDIRDRAGMSVKKEQHVVVVKKKNEVGGESDFIRWMCEFGESKEKRKTRESYDYGWKVLHAYCKHIGRFTLTFDDIDYARLTDYARWLRSEGYSDATRHMMESYVRAAYKEAQKRNMVALDKDPYRYYSIKPVPLKNIDRLSATEMRQLMNVRPSQEGLRRARDLALMSFYLCGANLLDLYEMHKPKNGAAVFVRHKLEGRYNRELEIPIEPELSALIERYKGKDGMLLFKAAYPNYESFRQKIGHRLRELSDELGFVVTMAKIRRSWASIAGSLEVSEYVINKSMGHVDSTINARFYEEYEWSRTHAANRKVIDYVLAA